MNKEMLCGWLDLPKAVWPPDAWALMGLPKGEHDPAALEKRVQERMAKLRSYQLSFPEEATEGMNRLAEAFVTLTEACSKKAPTPAIAKPVAAAISKDETSVTHKTQLDWQAAPPPVRKETASAPEMIVDDEPGNGHILTAKPFVAPARPTHREIDPVQTRELAEQSDEATSNLATLDAVIERIEETRRLLHVWDQLGKHLKATPKKTSSKESEAFAARLDKIAQAMRGYPPFLGQPGLPGYRVVVQARFKIPLLSVRSLPAEQREDLIFDWQAGRQVLLVHRRYLRGLFRTLRRRTSLGLFFHAVRATVNDHPRLTLAGILAILVVIGGGVSWLYR